MDTNFYYDAQGRPYSTTSNSNATVVYSPKVNLKRWQDPIKQRERYLRWKKNHPDGPRLASKKWKKNHPSYIHPLGKRITGMVQEIKRNPCMDCGITYPSVCMEFDHRDRSTKVNNVGTMVAHHYSEEKILAEIAKCDLVCSNCHRIRTKRRYYENDAKPKGAK